jgi:hypothetical protein
MMRGLAVELRERLRLLELEALGLVGIDAAEPEHGRHDVGAGGVPARRAAATSRSPVASMTTSPMTASRPPLLSQMTPTMRLLRTMARENRNAAADAPGLAHHVVDTRFQPSGIEGGGVADRVWLQCV